MDSLNTVKAFVEQINSHDVNGMMSLMAETHCFIDSLGNVVSGHQALHAAWAGYFGLIPNYRITVGEWLCNGAVVVLLGQSGGSYHGVLWETPVACRALVRDRQLAEWRVYADNEPLRQLMNAKSQHNFEVEP